MQKLIKNVFTYVCVNYHVSDCIKFIKLAYMTICTYRVDHLFF